VRFRLRKIRLPVPSPCPCPSFPPSAPECISWFGLSLFCCALPCGESNSTFVGLTILFAVFANWLFLFPTPFPFPLDDDEADCLEAGGSWKFVEVDAGCLFSLVAEGKGSSCCCSALFKGPLLFGRRMTWFWSTTPWHSSSRKLHVSEFEVNYICLSITNL
jgi:hypothetical protein